MSDSNLDDVLGSEVEEVKTESKPKSAPKPAAKKVEAAPVRENPIPLVDAIDGLVPGDKGFNYAQATKVIQTLAKETADHAKALADASRELHVLKCGSAPRKTDHEMYLENKANVERIAAQKDEKKLQVQAVLKEMGLL